MGNNQLDIVMNESLKHGKKKKELFEELALKKMEETQ